MTTIQDISTEWEPMVNIKREMENLTPSNESKKKVDPILEPSNDRFVLFPNKDSRLWFMYKSHEAAVWSASEIILSEDLKGWAKLTPVKQNLLKNVLAFFR